MKEFIDKTSKRFVRVEVIEPVTITTKEHFGWSSSFTTYLICIKTNHWAFSLHDSEVRRRFSDFCWLRSKLQEHHPNKIVPPLPAKRYFHITKFDPKVIQNRCEGLEKFLQRVMRSFVFLSDAALHLFLQSELSIAEIEEKLNEEIKPHYVTKRINSSGSTGSNRSTNGIGRSPPTNIEFQRSISDDGSNRSSLVSTSGSENDSHRSSMMSCGGSSVESNDILRTLDLSKLDIHSHPPSRTPDKMETCSLTGITTHAQIHSGSQGYDSYEN